jgi:putative sterol carrier protein
VAEFLSDEWLDELDRAARAAVGVPEEVRLVVQQVVVEDEERGEVTAYAMRLADGTATVTRGHADAADITFTQDRATAAAIARGELSAQSAFLAGRLRVGGDLRAALEQARAVAAVEDVFSSVRASTTW